MAKTFFERFSSFTQITIIGQIKIASDRELSLSEPGFTHYRAVRSANKQNKQKYLISRPKVL
jgi:hypothetical protein